MAIDLFLPLSPENCPTQNEGDSQFLYKIRCPPLEGSLDQIGWPHRANQCGGRVQRQPSIRGIHGRPEREGASYQTRTPSRFIHTFRTKTKKSDGISFPRSQDHFERFNRLIDWELEDEMAAVEERLRKWGRNRLVENGITLYRFRRTK